MSSNRKMHLVAFLLAGPTAHHHGAWRHPEADLGVFTPQFHEHIARVLEGGKFDSLFFADILGLHDLFGGSFATTWHITQSSVFVAQWAGDSGRPGQGSKMLTVTVR